jgi:leader peptidase (prepilin peptidase)/N-methyltransferase
MPLDVLSVLACAAATAALCATGPLVIRRLPEPVPDAIDGGASGATAAEAGVPGLDVEPKVPYERLAASPGLGRHLAIAGAVAGGVVGAGLGTDPAVLPWIYLAAVGVLLGYVDWHTRLLPTAVIAPSYAAVGGLLVAAALLSGSWRLLLGAAGGWLVMGGFCFLLWFVHPAGLGYGDVRLAGLLGLGLGSLGWGQLLTGMYAGFLVGAVGGTGLALLRLADRKRYAFGPFLVLGALVGMLFGGALERWYASW